MSLEIFDKDKNTWIDIYLSYKKNNSFIGLFGKGLRKVNKISEEIHIINFNSFKKGGIKNYIDLCYEPHIYKNLFIPIDDNYCMINDEEKTIYDIKKENMFRMKFSHNNVSMILHCNNKQIKNKIEDKNEDRDKTLIKTLSSYNLLVYILNQKGYVDKYSYSLLKITKNDIIIKLKNYLFKEKKENDKYFLYFSFYLFQNNYVDTNLLKELNSIYNIDISYQIKFIED